MKLKNSGEDCWYKCNNKQGSCLWCGTGGMCCTQKANWNDTSNGCDGTLGGQEKHECILKPSGKGLCIQKDQFVSKL